MVLIYFNFNGNLGIVVKTFCRFAVPVFFIVSGFFLLSSGQLDDNKVVNKIRHIFKLLLVAGVFYAIFTLVVNMATNKEWVAKQYALEKLTSDKIVKFFITNDPFVYSHLWFLMALIYCYIFMLLFFGKSSRLVWVNFFAPLLLIAFNCLQEFNEWVNIKRSAMIPGTEGRIYFFNLFVFRALPFFMFGIILCRYKEKIAKIRLRNITIIILIVSGGVIAILERFTFGETQFFVGTYLMVAAMFIWAIREPSAGHHILEHIGRDLSLYVYIFHIAVGRVIDTIIGALRLKGAIGYNYSRAFIILLTSILTAEVINMGKNFITNRKDLGKLKF